MEARALGTIGKRNVVVKSGLIALGMTVSTVSAPSQAWRGMEVHVGRFAASGQMLERVPLYDLKRNERLLFRFHLAHELEPTFSESARSRWIVPQLQSFLLQLPGGIWQWKPPGDVVLPVPAVSGRASVAAPKLGLRLEGKGETVVIRDEAGFAFFYVAGELVKISAFGSFFAVTARRGRIFSIVDQSDGKPLVRATYNSAGCIQTLDFTDAQSFRFFYSPYGQLTRVTRVRGKSLEMYYRDGMIAAIAITGKVVNTFCWARNEHHGRGYPGLTVPQWLVADKKFSYNWSVKEDVLRIQAEADDLTANLIVYGRWGRWVLTGSDGVVRTGRTPVTAKFPSPQLHNE